MKVSVIIAIYNAEKYLLETLNSIEYQTLDDYEIIAVNDGSTDASLDILTEYASRSSKLVIINKENGGPSAARNAGMKIAKGDFLFFLDADDLVEPDTLESLYKKAFENDADLVIAKYDIFNKHKIVTVNNIDELVKCDVIEKYNLQILWTFSLWNKLFRKSVINRYNLLFPPISYSEDAVFVMQFVYRATKITGLNKIVLHYRRMYEGIAESITASVTPAKIRDYITAHKLVISLAEESFLRDYPQYKSIDEAKKREIVIREYCNAIIRKELHILLNQFYVKYWDLEEETVEEIVKEFEENLRFLDAKAISLLVDSQPEYNIFQLRVKQKDVLANAHFTAVLYGDETNVEKFLECLKSLSIQNLIALKIILPTSMRHMVEEAKLMRGNVSFLDVSSERELFYCALKITTTPYIIFCNPQIIYTNNAFKFIFKRFIKSPADFIIQLIYHTNYGEPQPVYLNRIALESLKTGIENNQCLSMDFTLANKFFRTDFLKTREITLQKNILDYLPDFLRNGYYVFHNDGIVIYEDLKDKFFDFIGTDETLTFIKEYLKEKEITLNSQEILLNPCEAYSKLQLFPYKRLQDKLMKKAVDFFRKRKLKEQVLFISIRKDGELEGNAAALYPFVNGKKVICAKQLPHNWIVSALMFWRIVTSKVIITDDYVRYLRYFPLKKEQRVVQLWHACGAFKKFGQRGTNIALGTDRATHIQYNIACVSSEYIREIYADAFDINLVKVRALGCPRTDVFFDESRMRENRQKVFEKYPEFEGKFIIVYAPTFRDIGKDRTCFTPALDFEKLSKQLLSNQIFIICPHPIMKNKILDRDYSNIKEIRDFSTNDIMLISDMLVTDYSSVIFEYVLLKKPIAFFCYDLVIYNRGFYLKYPEDLPGNVYETQERLTEFLRNPELHIIDDKYNLFVKRYMSACDGHCSERIAGLINDYMEG